MFSSFRHLIFFFVPDQGLLQFFIGLAVELLGAKGGLILAQTVVFIIRGFADQMVEGRLQYEVLFDQGFLEAEFGRILERRGHAFIETFGDGIKTGLLIHFAVQPEESPGGLMLIKGFVEAGGFGGNKIFRLREEGGDVGDGQSLR